MKRKQTYEVYNHSIVWIAAEKNLLLAEPDQKDAKFFSLGAMFLFFAAFEGYLNWLGNRIDSELWKSERQFFSREPYVGTVGKYLYLAKILCLPKPDITQEPFKTADSLHSLRNIVAHPKTEQDERTINIKEGELLESYKSYQGELEKRVSPVAAMRARDHLKQLAEALHAEAKRIYPDEVYEPSPFGIIQRELA